MMQFRLKVHHSSAVVLMVLRGPRYTLLNSLISLKLTVENFLVSCPGGDCGKYSEVQRGCSVEAEGGGVPGGV